MDELLELELDELLLLEFEEPRFFHRLPGRSSFDRLDELLEDWLLLELEDWLDELFELELDELLLLELDDCAVSIQPLPAGVGAAGAAGNAAAAPAIVAPVTNMVSLVRIESLLALNIHARRNDRTMESDRTIPSRS